ncbi:membrane fusion protein (multidrug efflux system) [Mesocricetibacter intestinalis]|uniref:Membrane fusion protein (Multidrug efflux system) n=1 Tax=Mesocricetibacter intestinalis TaxID=1521930 RepID=A0A4R6VG50_9PAST|nr:EmrA/EmrK family multidrug efflux transporter periplasmic adaptor subunit [Mesocricetibacter intestinalis]TDQ59781.1 membrane fusion protein (multidrug efflux system) [Mesocricetibacter intestinalis]
MSESSAQSATHKSKKRKKALSIFITVLVLIALAVGIYWFVFIKDYEETEDAYVAGNQVMVSAQVSGSVKRINAEDMDFVRAGDVLIELDDTDLKLVFEQAKDRLASAVRQISQLHYLVKQLEASVRAKQVLLAQAEGNLARREQLAKSQAIDKESLQHAREAVSAAKAELDAMRNQLEANQALLMQTPLRQQPEVRNAASALKKAWLDLQRSKILSPLDGYVARRNVQIGQKLSVGSPLLAVISSEQMWVDANFKETQLTNMRIGQPVTLHFDLYGTDAEFEGRVEGIDMGTGSAFSLLPAQNATGNWIKVVQRVPVRIALDPEQMRKFPLRIGLSASVSVNVGDKSGEVLGTRRTEPLYATDVLDYHGQEAEQLIEQIIRDNIH